MKRTVGALGALMLVGIVYMLLWPVPIDPEAWQPQLAPPLEGPYAVNTRLVGAEHITPGIGIGPEDVTFDSEGRMYSGYVDGRIIRWSADASDYEVFCDTGGRPLGLAFDADGNLLCADADKGLLSISPAGEITVLADEHDGLRFGFTDDLGIAPDGAVYFTDASHKFHYEDSVTDIIENRPNGRLLAYYPDTGETELITDNLHFANGVAVHPSGDYLLVTETARYRIYKVWLTADRRYEIEVFKDNLPGFPDNIRYNGDGIFWVALPAPRNPILDATANAPWLRKMIVRLPQAVQPKAAQYGFILGLDEDANVVHNLQDPVGGYAPITSVNQYQGSLYLGSIEANAVGRIPAP